MLSCAGHWPPKYRADGGFSTAPAADFPAGSSLLRAASLAVALARSLLCFGLSGNLSSSRYITGTLLLAIAGPFSIRPPFKDLEPSIHKDFLNSGSIGRQNIPKTIGAPPIAGTVGRSAYLFQPAESA